MLPGLPDRDHDRPNRRKRPLRPKNGSLRSPTTNRRPVGDIAAWGKPENRGHQSVLQSVEGVFAFTWGRCPQTPGIYRFRACISVHAGAIKLPRLMLAPRSALRSHPCVAVSSAQACSVYTRSTLHQPKYLRTTRHRVITSLVLDHFYWPVLK